MPRHITVTDATIAELTELTDGSATILHTHSLGADDNYVTDAEKTKLSNISITQAVDLDTLESDTTTNNAKVTNATHTGEVTGSGALTVDKTAITGKTEVTAVGTDYVLISDSSDSGNLKKALASDLAGGGSGLTQPEVMARLSIGF